MLFNNKFKRKRMTREEADAIIERAKTESPLELEKGDKLAMFFAALIVFVPFVLVFCGILVFAWFFLFRIIGA
jgi:hypothetical protein